MCLRLNRFTAILLVMWIAAGAFGQLIRKGSVVHYKIPILQEEKSISDPTSHWSYFFELKPGVKLLPGAYVELVYTYSSTLLKGRGSLTVTLNDKPLATKELPFMEEAVTTWRVPLPANLIKQGFNEVKINNRQRSIDGPCQDVDNMGNWIRFLTTSHLKLSRQDVGAYPLVSYPFPYLDNLATSPVQASWIVPNQPNAFEVSEALNMAGNWGNRLMSGALRMNVQKGTAPNGLQAVYVGEAIRFTSLPASSAALGIGFAEAYSEAGRARLAVLGRATDGLQAIQRAFARQDLVNQMQGDSVGVNNVPVRPEAPRPRARMGEFTFEDLGMSSIVLSGAFHREATMTIMRPLRIDLGRESTIKIKFRHAASLNPLRSLLTVYVNKIPIGSAQLMPSNANGGVLEARIPIDVLAQNRWIFEFAVYHDLGSLDCSKSYDEVAWSVIEVDSALTLKPGLLTGRPYLENFPYLIPNDGVSPDQTAFYLPDNPSNAVLSLASTITAKAAQSNNVPLYWTGALGAIAKKEGHDSAIVIGSFTDTRRFAPIAESLLVSPSADGKLTFSKRVQLIPAAIKGGVIIQAVPNKWSDKGVMYVILASDDAAMRRFTDFLGTRRATEYMAGEACLFTKEGKLVQISLETPDDAGRELAREAERYTPTMKLIALVLILIFIGAVIWTYNQFRKRTPKNPTP